MSLDVSYGELIVIDGLNINEGIVSAAQHAIAYAVSKGSPGGQPLVGISAENFNFSNNLNILGDVSGGGQFNINNIGAIGKLGSGAAFRFSHIDQVSDVSYALQQTRRGRTNINSAGNDLSLRIDNDIKLLISTLGNVGIGTENPNTKLEVVGDISATSLTVDSSIRSNGILYSAGTTRLRGVVRADTGLGILTGSASLECPLTIQTDGLGTGFNSDSQVRIQDDETINKQYLKMGVNSSFKCSYLQSTQDGVSNNSLLLNPNGGNVGIGTISPSKKLEVVGDISSTSLTVDSSIRSNGILYSAGTTRLGGAVRADTGLGILTGSASLECPLEIQTTGAGFGGDADSQVRIQDDETSDKQYLKMGVNTSFNYSYLQSTQQGVSHNSLSLNPNGGNVGIGTTSPNQKLHIDGGRLLVNNGLTLGGTEKECINLGLNGSWTNAINSKVVNAIEDIRNYIGIAPIYSENTRNTVLSVHGNGNVGIGTISPSKKLVVIGDTSFNGNLYISHPAGGSNPALTINATNGQNSVVIRNSKSIQNNLYTLAGKKGAALLIHGGDGEIANSGSGTLGISGVVRTGGLTPYFEFLTSRSTYVQLAAGTHTALQQGDVIGGIHWNGDDGTHCRTIGAIIQGIVTDTPQSSKIPTDLVFYTANTTQNPTERMRITKDGNVGIGKSVLRTQLDVNGKIYCEALTLYIRGNTNSPSNVGVLETIQRGSSSIGIRTNYTSSYSGNPAALLISPGGDLVLETRTDADAYTENARITTNGNVGIGTSTPNAKLDVKGDIRMSALTGVNPSFMIDGNVFFLNRTNNSVALSSYDDFYFYTGATAGRETGTNTFAMIDNNLYFNGGNDKFMQFTTNNGNHMRLYSGQMANHEASVYFRTSSTDHTNPTVQIGQWGGNSNLWVNFAQQSQPDSSYKLKVTGSAHATGTFVDGSDDRIKHNEVDVSNALTTINKLIPKKYIKTETMYDESGNYYGKNHNFSVIPNNANYEAGLIAQDISNTIPELNFVVKRSFDGSGNIRLDESGNEDILGLDYRSISIFGIKAIQELHELVLAQASTINNLQSQIQDLSGLVRNLT